MQFRMACGHYVSPGGTDCDCGDAEGPSIDVWAVAGGDVNLDRLAETRSYRQSKFRNLTGNRRSGKMNSTSKPLSSRAPESLTSQD